MKLEQLKSKITANIQCLQDAGAKLRKEYAESDQKIAFVKTVFTREILERKERIPGAIITAWILILLIFSYSWTYGMNWSTVFNFGVLPAIVYYIVRALREAPSS
ncbi:MAG: hypothetical protein ACRESZ_13385 [Methylococcales bacterium]